jgi:endoglucanase
MNTFRIGFRWERLQPNAYGEFAPEYAGRLENIVSYATSRGAFVVLDPHNFARYYDETIGSPNVPNAVFADFWGRMAMKYGSDERVLFNLVNEPRDIGTEQWVDAANAAIVAIRLAGAKNLILVPGNGWTGAHSWDSSYYGTPNSEAMLDITDPQDNSAFEVHQYLDKDSSGSSPDCESATIGHERLEGFVRWLRAHGKKGFLGEFAGANNRICNAAVKNMLRFVHDSSDVFIGWLWWAAGPWWGDYAFAIEPKNGKDRPQMSLLEPFLH